MLKEPISITAIGTVSPLGDALDTVWKHYRSNNHNLIYTAIGGQKIWVGRLLQPLHDEIEKLRASDNKYRGLDDSVLYALHASRKAIAMAGWAGSDNFGINIGSSRGATTLFEKHHTTFIQEGKTSTLASPTTTLGNISSWVAHDLKTKGPDISHSITCSTGLHSLLNGIAWLNSGMTDKFLVGGSEAPLTPFTIAQMQALKIYAKNDENDTAAGEEVYPCLALDLEKTKNTMVLGEGAVMACLEKDNAKEPLAKVIGVGFATEPLLHNVSISTDAQCFQDSMMMALNGLPPEKVDVIVTHAPGTIKGDISEYKAVEKVFCNKIPFLTTNKWKVGHTFATSGMLSIEMAILMLQHQKVINVPYLNQNELPEKIETIMVNAVGFGGNAVSILLSN